jgi:nitroimidazol reductase NimA-like FMN-containing flavoprotein (pyridoxamine 5'-phosphate oxidase superfamily)
MEFVYTTNHMRKPDTGSPMSGPLKEQFLENEDTGILSVSTEKDEPPYSIPVSFAFDKQHNRIIFQFVNHEDSTKMKFIGEGIGATLTVIDQLAGNGWTSEAIIGTLTHLTGKEMEFARRIFDESTNGTVSVFPERDDYHVEWWALNIEKERGRHSKTHGLSLAG